MLWVVEACEVSENGCAFHDGIAVFVVVYNYGDASIGVDLCEPGLLVFILEDVDALVRVIFSVGFF